jgi:SanA protein
MRAPTLRRGLKRLSIAFALVLAFVVAANAWVLCIGWARERDSVADLADAPVAIVLGASVKADGTPSDALLDRLQQALELYRGHKVAKILLSGDHGRPDYDETNTMRRWLSDRGLPPEALFCDHAGFTTYDTMVRAKRILGVERAIVVTQRFHLPRALYTAQAVGLTVEGAPCDQRTYQKGVWFGLREIGARTKAFVEAGLLESDPRVLGPAIPITGDGRATWDEPN